MVALALTEEAEVAEVSDSKGEPDERAQECPADAAWSKADCTAGRERADGDKIAIEIAEKHVHRSSVPHRSDPDGAADC